MSGIDWSKVKERLRTSELALRKAFEGDPEKIQSIRLVRARDLAKTEQQQRGASVFVLRFRLTDQSYAVPLTDLAGVHNFASFTPLPEAPPHLLGLVSHRGRILSLLSLKKVLLESDQSPDNPGCALLLRAPNVACCVDAFDDIVEIDRSQIRSLDDGAVPRLDLGPEGLMILTGSRLAEHPCFQSRGGA